MLRWEAAQLADSGCSQAGSAHYSPGRRISFPIEASQADSRTLCADLAQQPEEASQARQAAEPCHHVARLPSPYSAETPVPGGPDLALVYS